MIKFLCLSRENETPNGIKKLQGLGMPAIFWGFVVLFPETKKATTKPPN